MFRRVKLAYEIYNFFHKSQLKYNTHLYEKFGLKKKYYSSISSEDFSNLDEQTILNQGRSGPLSDIEWYNQQTAESKASIDQFDEQGYCIIRNFLDQDQVDKINNEIDTLLTSKKIKFKYGNKLMFVINKSPFLRELWARPTFTKFLDYLIYGKAKLFQSINFINGSQQKTHSDSIHMTTFPMGGLLGVWVALEKVSKENGTIHYYPGSHKLPYYMNRDYDNVGTSFMLGKNGYKAYEEMISQKVKENKIEKQIFEANPGDLFIWHANLLHGGEPHTNKSLNRKSMVLHYFDERRICYHEISQRPALMKEASQQ